MRNFLKSSAQEEIDKLKIPPPRGVIRKGDRIERKGEIEIYNRVVTAGVIGCDSSIFGTSEPWLSRQVGRLKLCQEYQISSHTWPTEMEYLNEKKWKSS